MLEDCVKVGFLPWASNFGACSCSVQSSLHWMWVIEDQHPVQRRFHKAGLKSARAKPQTIRGHPVQPHARGRYLGSSRQWRKASLLALTTHSKGGW
eukprot:1142665-Pelagomonas_calceolata.AAC.9